MPERKIERDVHLTDYLRLLRRQRWLITTVFAVTFVTGTIWTLLQTPIYQAAATVLIEPEPPKVLNIQEVTTIGSQSTEYYRTQYALIQSRAVMVHAVEALTRAGRTGALAALGAGKDSRAHAVGTLAVEPVRGTQLVMVKFEHPDPAIAAEVANAIANAYVRYNLDTKLKGTRDALNWLNEQLGGLRARVQESAVALQNYRVRSGLLGLQEQRQISAQKIMEVNKAYLEAQSQRLSLEAKLRELSRISRDRAVSDTLPAVVDDPLIRKLRAELAELQIQRSKLLQTYKEKHPEVLKLDAQIQQMTQRLDAELGKMLRNLETEYKLAKAREDTLLGSVNHLRREGQDVNEKEIAYLALQRENESNQQLYEAVLKRVKETGVAGGLDTNNVRVVEDALPPASPIKPRRLLSLLVTLALGLVAGLGAAIALEYFDTSLKSSEDVERVLGLPVLAIVPAFEERR